MREFGGIECDFETCTFGGGPLCVAADAPLFVLSLRDPDGGQTVLDGRNAAFTGTTENDGTVTAGYDCGGVTVRLRIRAEAAAAHFGLEVTGLSERRLEWVEYAPLCVPRLLAGDGGTGRILWPLNEGVLVSRYADREDSFLRYREPEYPSEGSYGVYPNMVESQFIAYLSDGKGVYLGAHDETCGTKSIDFKQTDDCIYIRVRAFTDTAFGEDYISDYDTVVRFFDGDWMSAADIYYEWFSRTVGAKYVKTAADDSLPDWYRASPVVVAYPVRGRHDTDRMTPNKMYPYTAGLDVLRRLSRETGSPVMALLMHWEGTAPWAPPYVWPPYGGEENFRRFADALHAEGNYLGVYCSGLGWTEKSKLTGYNREEDFAERGYADIMCLAPDGSLPYSKICTAQRVGYDMCPACRQTKEIVRTETEKIAAAGVDYIQVLDQNHGGTGYFCYAAGHGHNPGPGRWQAAEMRALLEPLTGRGKPLLGCESAAADCYLDRLRFSDNRFELNQFIGECVPLYAYLYHEYLYNFMGNQVCLLLQPSPTNYLYRLAYSFAAGDAATIVIDENGAVVQNWGQTDFSVLPDRAASLALIGNCNAWRRRGAAKFLTGGKMIRPHRLDCGSVRIPVCPVRDDIVAPAALSSRWRAADGETAQFTVNYTAQTVVARADGAVRVRPDPDDETRAYLSADGTISIPPYSAVLWESEGKTRP